MNSAHIVSPILASTPLPLPGLYDPGKAIPVSTSGLKGAGHRNSLHGSWAKTCAVIPQSVVVQHDSSWKMRSQVLRTHLRITTWYFLPRVLFPLFFFFDFFHDFF